MLLVTWLSAKDRRYDELVNRYECRHGICEADFNGDGIAGRIVQMQSPNIPSEEWLIVTDEGREVFRIPYEYVDGTFRTHVAVQNETGAAHIIVFDGTKGETVREVFAWSGQSMSPVPPSSLDNEILSAMSARDDAGTWNFWGIYRFLHIPLIIGYYSLLAIFLTWIILRSNLFGIRKRPQ